MKRFFAALSLAMTTVVMAEMPDSAYYELQQRATDVYYITVRRVQVERPNPSSERIRWTVRIDKVVRSRTGVKAGRQVTFETTQAAPGVMVTGPRRAPHLRAGAKTIVFLNRTENTFSLAKYGRSFEVTPKPREPRKR